MALGSYCVINARGHRWGLVGAVTLPEAHRVGGHSLVIRDHIRKYHSLSVACKDMKGLQSIMPSSPAHFSFSWTLPLSSPDAFPSLRLFFGIPSQFLFFQFIFIYLSGCTASLLQHARSSSLTRDQTWVPYIGSVES